MKSSVKHFYKYNHKELSLQTGIEQEIFVTDSNEDI
jgi:hypothetical protein